MRSNVTDRALITLTLYLFKFYLLFILVFVASCSCGKQFWNVVEEVQVRASKSRLRPNAYKKPTLQGLAHFLFTHFK